jgi:hypothetical protein
MNYLFDFHYNMMLNNPDDYIDFCENQDLCVKCVRSQIKYILNNISLNNICFDQYNDILNKYDNDIVNSFIEKYQSI